MQKAIVVQHEGLLPTKGRRVLADVDQHVVNGAVRATDQLGFAAPGAAVHPSDHSFGRTRLRILDKRGSGTRPAEVFVEDVRVEGAGEQAAVVPKRLRRENENVREIGRFDAHLTMLT